LEFFVFAGGDGFRDVAGVAGGKEE